MRLPGVALSVLLPALVVAQPPTRIEIAPQPTCRDCRIELTKVATLGNPRDSALLTTRSTPVRDSRGRYYAWSANRAQVAVYDSSGAFIGTIGRPGEGPGEFAFPGGRILVGAGDSLRFFQGRAFQVWSPQYRYVRVHPAPGPTLNSPLLLADGRMVFPTWITSGSGVGQPLHLLSPDGALLKSFGSTQPLDQRACPECYSRALSASREAGTVWSALTRAYEIEKWTLDGRLALTIVNPRSPWLPSQLSDNLRVGKRDPDGRTAFITAIREDDDGLIWVLGSTGKAAPVDPDRRGIRVVPERPIEEVNASSKQILDVIDPVRRTIVASRTIEGTRYSPIARDLLYSTRDDADGYVYIDIWRVRLVSPGR